MAYAFEPSFEERYALWEAAVRDPDLDPETARTLEADLTKGLPLSFVLSLPVRAHPSQGPGAWRPPRSPLPEPAQGPSEAEAQQLHAPKLARGGHTPTDAGREAALAVASQLAVPQLFALDLLLHLVRWRALPSPCAGLSPPQSLGARGRGESSVPGASRAPCAHARAEPPCRWPRRPGRHRRCGGGVPLPGAALRSRPGPELPVLPRRRP